MGRTNKVRFVILIGIILSFSIELQAQNMVDDYPLEEDDECEVNGSVEGICKKASSCKMLSKMNSIYICDLPLRHSQDMLVCCPGTIDITSVASKVTTTTTKMTTKTTKKVPPITSTQPPIFLPGRMSVHSKSHEACINFGNKPLTIKQNVIGGDESEIAEFPHMAAIGFAVEGESGSFIFDCGGTLISNKFVVSAAHCSNQKNNKPKIVRLGRTSLDLTDDYDLSEYLDIKILNIIKHPDYTMKKKYNDLVLFELEQTVEFASNIWPACLNENFDLFDKQLLVSGWGRNDVIDAQKRPTWLQKALTKQFPDEECNRKYSGLNIPHLPNGTVSSQFCAHNKTSDTCQGDSGGPIQFLVNKTYYLAGVTSFGAGCKTNYPSVYTRISEFTSWIEQIVWP